MTSSIKNFIITPHLRGFDHIQKGLSSNGKGLIERITRIVFGVFELLIPIFLNQFFYFIDVKILFRHDFKVETDTSSKTTTDKTSKIKRPSSISTVSSTKEKNLTSTNRGKQISPPNTPQSSNVVKGFQTPESLSFRVENNPHSPFLRRRLQADTEILSPIEESNKPKTPSTPSTPQIGKQLIAAETTLQKKNYKDYVAELENIGSQGSQKAYEILLEFYANSKNYTLSSLEGSLEAFFAKGSEIGSKALEELRDLENEEIKKLLKTLEAKQEIHKLEQEAAKTNNVETYLTLIGTYLGLKKNKDIPRDPTKADAFAKKAIDLSVKKQKAQTLFRIGQIYFDARKEDEAETYLAPSAKENNVDAMLLLCWMHLQTFLQKNKKNSFNEAKALLTQASSILQKEQEGPETLKQMEKVEALNELLDEA